jgi:hypothetical protein
MLLLPFFIAVIIFKIKPKKAKVFIRAAVNKSNSTTTVLL